MNAFANAGGEPKFEDEHFPSFLVHVILAAAVIVV